MSEGDIVLNTFRKFIREDKIISEEVCTLELIRNADKYLTLQTSRDGGAEGSLMDTKEQNGALTLKEKTTLMGLLREIVEGGGEIPKRDEIVEGVERVIEEGRERGDEEGMKAEREGEFLLWVIEKKKRGKELKSRREIEREKEEEMKKRTELEKKKEEAESREAEEKKRREKAEREREEQNRTIELMKREKAERDRRISELEKQLSQIEKSIITKLSELALHISDDNRMRLNGNSIFHYGAHSYETCHFTSVLSNVCVF